MKRSLIAALLASTSLFLSPHNSYAVIPVTDAAAESTLASQLAQQIKMVADMATQIQQLTSLVSLATIAGTLLGSTVDPALTGVFNDLQTAYSNSMNAYGSIMRAPERVDQELQLFEPPPQGWDSMSFPQLVARAKKIQELTKGTNAATVSKQADMLERRVELAQQQAIANRWADTSVSALSATQAVAQQMRVTGQILGNIEESSANMATIMAEKLTDDEAMNQMVTDLHNKDMNDLRIMVSQPAGKIKTSVVQWGE